MNGCVFKRKLPSGKVSWGYSVDLGKDSNGKRIQEFKSGYGRKTDADEALRKRLNEKDTGGIVKPDPTAFANFMNEWFTEYAERQCAPKTVERYREMIDSYVLPHIGETKIQELSALTLERLFNHLKDGGGHDRKTKKPRPLSAKTVRNIAGVVHTALATAMRWKLLASNPMDAVQLPKVEKHEAQALGASQLAWYLDAARAHGLFEIVNFAAATGCRRGEILALTWPDLDLVNRSVSITKSLEQTKAGLRLKTTKNQKPRLISLPHSIPPILEAHRAQQGEHRTMFGPDYRTDLNLVFCDVQGDYLKPDSVTAKGCLMAKQAGLKDTSLHTLRHSHGSQLLSAGVPLPTVSKRLGHSSVYVTATVYSHALAKDEAAAADAWDAAVHDAIKASTNAKVS